ncbi:hypothetical protein F4805DRAFT_407799 [Annulohypoxylon moriforme]|nr:hypothetical protein F4805DRAFT_407799 [Annulohypoxylon moriforme]
MSIIRVGSDISVTLGPPKAILLSSPTTKDLNLEGLRPGLLPMFPVKVPATSKSTRPFNRQGFYLTPTFAITDYKAQGSFHNIKHYIF